MPKECADVVDLELHPLEPLSKLMASLVLRSLTPRAVILPTALPRDFHLAGLTQLEAGILAHRLVHPITSESRGVLPVYQGFVDQG